MLTGLKVPLEFNFNKKFKESESVMIRIFLFRIFEK